MLQEWAIHFAIQFVVRQLGKFGKDTDWAKVKDDFHARVMALVPGSFFDDEAAAAVDAVLEACQKLLSSGEALDHILTYLADQRYSEAADALKQLLFAVWAPTTPAGHKALAALHG